MLVLSRKVGQQIHIGDGIVVTVNRINGNRVTLGLVAPQGVHILRGELKSEAVYTPPRIAERFKMPLPPVAEPRLPR